MLKTYIKLMPGLPLSSASRNKREMAAAREAGYRVVAIYYEPDYVPEAELAGVELVPFKMRPLKGKHSILSKWKHIFGEWIRLGRVLHANHPDVISCHNLPNLEVAYIVTRFFLRRPKLIYDSHEFDLYARGVRKEKDRAKRCWKERFLMRRCAFSIMVNDSIADEVQKIHALKQRPVVIRSTPYCWELDEAEIERHRQAVLREFAPQGVTFLAMFHGGLSSGNGIETGIRAVAKIPSAALILMGNSDDEYRRTLEEIAAKCGAAERLRFLPPVPVNEIWKYAGAMDVGIMPIENLCLSYYYTLPNKFFENVQSLTPVICSDLPEMHRLVDEYGIGLICEPENVDDLAQRLERMRTDREFYNSCKQNLLRAKRELCWEREKTVLLDAYRKYLL